MPARHTVKKRRIAATCQACKVQNPVIQAAAQATLRKRLRSLADELTNQMSLLVSIQSLQALRRDSCSRRSKDDDYGCRPLRSPCLPVQRRAMSVTPQRLPELNTSRLLEVRIKGFVSVRLRISRATLPALVSDCYNPGSHRLPKHARPLLRWKTWPRPVKFTPGSQVRRSSHWRLEHSRSPITATRTLKL